MNCPNCMIAYDPRHWEECPHCGSGGDGPEESAEISGVLRTSTILIAAGNSRSALYGSVEEVPEPLRRQLQESTSGQNSGTIYIADQRGRERIASALRNLPATGQGNWQTHDEVLAPVLTRFSATVAPPVTKNPKRRVMLSAVSITLMLLAVAGALVWLLEGREW